MMRSLRFPALAMGGALLLGCAAQHPVVEPDPLAENDRLALSTLAQVSIEARHELRLLAKSQESVSAESLTAEQHAQRAYQAVHVPEGFEQVRNFKFAGPGVEAARALAKLAGYTGDQFQVVNKPIANEPLVFIDIRNRPLVEALRELGMQTGDQVRVEVYEHKGLMRYVYADQ